MKHKFSLVAFSCAIESLEAVKHAVPTGANKGPNRLPASPQRADVTAKIQICIDNALGLVSSFKKVEDEISACYKEWNAHVPVGSIPPEILNMIFELIHAEKPASMRKMMLVCYRWRSIGITNPRFWTHICVSSQHVRYEEYVPMMFQRSRTLPLEVDFPNSDSASIRSAIQLTMTQHQRIRKLKLSGVYAMQQTLIPPASASYQWDALEVLEMSHWQGVDSITGSAGNIDLESNEHTNQPQYPRLQSLVFNNINVSLWRRLGFSWSSIRSLHVKGQARSISASTWAIVLSDMAPLEELTINHRLNQEVSGFRRMVTGAHRHSFASLVPISLSRLRRLTMTVWSLAEMEVFGRLEHPPETDVTVDFRTVQVNPIFILQRVLGLIRSKAVYTTIRRCSISVSSNDTDIALYQTTTSRPFLKLLVNMPEGLCQALAAIEVVYGLSEVEVLKVPLPVQYMRSSKGRLSGMKNVRKLEVPHLDTRDGLVLCASEPLLFPQVEHLVIRMPYVGAYPILNESNCHKLTDGVLGVLKARKDMGCPIRSLSLGPHLDSARLFKEIQDTMPEVFVYALPE